VRIRTEELRWLADSVDPSAIKSSVSKGDCGDTDADERVSRGARTDLSLHGLSPTNDQNGSKTMSTEFVN
jgi:hypothetical protein